MMSIGEPGSAREQTGKSARKLVSKAAQIVAPKSIYRDEDHQRRLWLCPLGRGGGGENQKCRQGTEVFQHAPI
jgi:hypothetical protein